MNSTKKTVFIAVCIFAAIASLYLMRRDAQSKGQTASAYIMNTMLSQKLYSENAKEVMQEVNTAVQAFEDEVSMHLPQSDIIAINEASGKEPVVIKERTYNLLMRAKELSLNSGGSFAITIAPLTKAWGITSQTPRVVGEAERKELIKLVDDSTLVLENNTAFLPTEKQGIDLGGIAKGTACDIAKGIYEKNNVDYALFNVGGSCIYVKGLKPDGTKTRLGFRDPQGDENASIASFLMSDMVFSTSGGYERYFEEGGVKYHHMLDPKTGAPAQSDILSIGIMCEEGTLSDFLSTSLYIKGKGAALEYMQGGGIAVMLDNEKNIYVSKALQDSFQLLENVQGYTLIFI